jgi:hypothetical protein
MTEFDTYQEASTISLKTLDWNSVYDINKYQEICLRSKARPVRKADNITASCEPVL